MTYVVTEAGAQPDPVGRRPDTTRKDEAPVDADAFKDEQDEFTKYFQDKPAPRP